jgi:vitamin B12 transporter
MRRYILAAACAAWPSVVPAATTIPQIVVSATRSPQEASHIASSVTVISEEEIAHSRRASVVELLRTVPGVAVAANGGAGQTARLFMRGTNSNHVLVLLDGIRLNDPSDPGDAFDFSALSLDNIERIEVLRGPQSTLYGSQALGGVVYITTKQGKGAPRHSAQAEYGRYNTSRLSAGSTGAVGRTSYSFQLARMASDGVSSLAQRYGGFEQDSTRAETLSLRLSQQASEWFTAHVSTRYQRTVSQFDSPGATVPRPADDTAPENDSRYAFGRLSGEMRHAGGGWVHELGVGYADANRQQIGEYYDSAFTALFGRQQYRGWRSSVDWIHRVSLLRGHALTFGVEHYTDHFKTLQVREKNVSNTGLFIDDTITLAEGLYFGASIRSDRHQSFGQQTTWRLAPSYTIPATATRLKATYGTGFKAPSLSQLYDSGSGNPNLRPERSKGVDVGFEQPLLGDRLSISATLFRNFIENLIGFDSSPPFRAINTGRARTQGVEAGITVRPTLALTGKLNYTFTQANDQRTDKELTRRPRHQLQLSADYQQPQWDVGAALRYVSSRRDFDVVNFSPTYGKAFTTVDMKGEYRLQPGLAVYGRLENLLDKRYEEVAGYGQPGRAAYAGVRADF